MSTNAKIYTNMKNKMIYIVASLLMLTVGFSSCEKKSEGLTSITYYAELELIGGSVVGVNLDGTYVEPGYKATMNGQDVTSQVKVSDNIDTSEKGVYSVVYSVTNADGFASTISRTVIVADLSDPIEGAWVVNPASYRIYNGGAPTPYKGAFTITIFKNDVGGYEVSDLMAGWYDQGAGYGPDFAMLADITVAGDGTITYVDSYVKGWGDAADDLKNAKYDAAANQISYQLFYASVIEFDVVLDKIAF